MAFINGLASLLADARPVGRSLEREQEDALNRFCLWLGCFEIGLRIKIRDRVVYPAWPWVRFLANNSDTPIERLLAYWPEPVVEDMHRLSSLFWETQQELCGRPCALNPTFEGSNSVGGADADLICNGCLLEFKTTVGTAVDTDWLYQLVGYAALDYSDRYGIRELGFYFPRHGRLVRWSTEEFLTRASSGAITSLPLLRAHVQARLDEYRRSRRGDGETP